MKYCVHGMGFMAECGELATTRREGWPLCEEHAQVWDGFERMQAAERLRDAEEIDFVAYARAVI